MTSEIWSSYRISIDIPDADHICTTAEIQYSEGCITFYSESGTIPSTLNLDEAEYRRFEETGEYEESDLYQELIMWGLNPNTAPTMTVTINNITGAYRELGQLTTQGFSDRSTEGYRPRADEILGIHRSRNAEDACRLIYDILRDIPLAEEDRRVLYVCILEIILASTHFLIKKQQFKEMLIALRDNDRGPTTFMDLFRALPQSCRVFLIPAISEPPSMVNSQPSPIICSMRSSSAPNWTGTSPWRHSVPSFRGEVDHPCSDPSSANRITLPK